MIVRGLLLDETGDLLPFRLLPARTLRVAEALVARVDAQPVEEVPEEARPLVALRHRELRERAAALAAHGTLNPAARAVQPTEEALGLVSAEVLADPGRVDRLIEALLRSTDNLTLGHAQSLDEAGEGGPGSLAQAARSVRSILFRDGRSFVQLPLDEQWMETDRRLDALDRAGLTWEDFKALGIDKRLEHLQVLNEHLGRLLGLTASAPMEPASTAELNDLAALNAQALRGINALLAVIYAAFPGESVRHVEARARLLQPLLEEISEEER